MRYVRDLQNDPNSSLGDFKEPVQNNADNLNSNLADYRYDGNGNLMLDQNKSISAITYNHLNLPANITITGKGTIEYVYDALGNKHIKIVHETGKPDKNTLYISGFVYEDDQLQFIPHEEGRIRITKDVNNNPNGFTYDYFLKDHLGNVRMVLTEEQQQTFIQPQLLKVVPMLEASPW